MPLILDFGDTLRTAEGVPGANKKGDEEKTRGDWGLEVSHMTPGMSVSRPSEEKGKKISLRSAYLALHL